MKYVTEGLQPAEPLRYFEEISCIPRASRNEKAVAQVVYDFAKGLGLDVKMDDAYNVVVKKPASPGCEEVPPLMLQGHMDMVCVKLPGVEHDFDKDPLQLEIVDGKLKAKGTTLGADNGTACAYMMALLAKDDYVHPPLECVFTTMEEIGLMGAMALDANWISARRMINMDSGASTDNQTVVSCAGGIVLDFTKQPQWQAAQGEALKLRISGLLGGHSAITIGEGRGNALKLMARVLQEVSVAVGDLQIAWFQGGMKMNAIVSEAQATITVPVGSGAPALAAAQQAGAKIKAELAASDPGFCFEAEAAALPAQTLSDAESAALWQFLFLLPDGMRQMSREMPGLVHCSSNIGILTMSPEQIYLCDCVRSAEDSLGENLAAELTALAGLLGFTAKRGISFSGWKYDPASPLRALCMQVYKDMFGREMELQATHGGLECGEFKGKFPDMDIMTVAPTCDGAHTPEEYIDLVSFARTYDYLFEVFRALCAQNS